MPRRAAQVVPGSISRWLPARGRRRVLTDWLSPSRMLVLSFAALVAAGTLGFRLLPGIYTGPRMGWIDSLFMATSAVCVTGLVVINPATALTFYGQLWALLLIQLGGLGLLTLTSGILLTVGRRLSLRHEELMRSPSEDAEIDYRQLVRRVLRYTMLIELAGAVVLYAGWVGELGVGGAIWPAVFHAVSAFCNAGFSLFAGNMADRFHDPLALAVVMALVVLGGLGFLTLTELSRWLRTRSRGRRRLSLHSRIVLVATVLAILFGALAFGAFEWDNTLAGMAVRDRVMNAFFGSITARTAGFNSIDYGHVSPPAAFATILLMFMGGAPGSTAGGVKVTTVALLVLLAASRLRGSRTVSAFHRTVPDETLGRASGLVVISMAILIAALFLLIATDPVATSYDAFVRYLFEAVSAFGTVGLSMDLTTSLSPASRLVIAALMFIGRVGVMSLAAALALEPETLAFRYAKEDVAVG